MFRSRAPCARDARATIDAVRSSSASRCAAIKPERATRVAQLPARVVHVAARRVLRPATRHPLARARRTARRRSAPPFVAARAPPATARRTSTHDRQDGQRASSTSRARRQARRATDPRLPRASRSARRTPSSTSSIFRWSSIQTGRMLQLCDDEHRSSPTGCDTQCRSNVVVSDASITSRIEISAGVARQRVPAARTARAAHDPGAPQAQQDLLDVVAGQPLALGDLAAGDRALRQRDGRGAAHR